ncbi:MAG: hypothetical protein ABJA49_01935 [Betaproteobacteria bacterium]
MNPLSVSHPLRVRMRQFARLHPALALVEYDCNTGYLGWTAACSNSLGIPIFLQPVSVRHWLSLFDRSTRKLMWRTCATLLTQRGTNHVLDLPFVTLADGRTTALTTQIDISYAPDQRPTRMSVMVLRLDGAEAAGKRALHRHARRSADSAGYTRSPDIPDSPSHAMRGRLGAIAAAVEVLRSGVGDDRIRERAFQIIDRQTQQLTSLVAATYDPDG